MADGLPARGAPARGAPSIVWAAIAVAALVTALFSMGRSTLPDREQMLIDETPADESNPPSVPAARSYRELGERPWGEPSDWESILAAFPLGGGAERGATLEELRAARAQRRAFDGAPPVVPHPVTSREPVGCLTCHEHGMAFPGGATAPRMSHAPLTSCTQCHVVQTAALFELDEQSEARAAKRLHSPSRAHTRAFLPGAPPVIPHSTFMRERCDACHGRGAANAIKSDHTERIHCRQCHATTRTPERYDTLAEAISR